MQSSEWGWVGSSWYPVLLATAVGVCKDSKRGLILWLKGPNTALQSCIPCLPRTAPRMKGFMMDDGTHVPRSRDVLLGNCSLQLYLVCLFWYICVLLVIGTTRAYMKERLILLEPGLSVLSFALAHPQISAPGRGMQRQPWDPCVGTLSLWTGPPLPERQPRAFLPGRKTED